MSAHPLLARNGTGGVASALSSGPNPMAASARESNSVRFGSSGRPLRGGLCALVASILFGCQTAVTVDPNPPPVPRGGPEVADAWLALIALEGRELVMADAPPPAAAKWCEPIPETPHYRCQIQLYPLLLWRARIVRYAEQIDELRDKQQ